MQSCQLRNGRVGSRRKAIGGPTKTAIHITVASPFPNRRAPSIAPHAAAPSIPHHARVDGTFFNTGLMSVELLVFTEIKQIEIPGTTTCCQRPESLKDQTNTDLCPRFDPILARVPN